MQLSVLPQANYVLAKTTGPIDETAAAPLKEHLHPLASARGARVVLDLSGSKRINSIGLGSLVALVARANSNGSRVVLCGLAPYVSVVFSTTRLDRFFEIAPSLEEAAAHFAA